MNTTEKLLRDLNSVRGVAYPDVGYTYYADVVGNGIAKPRVYTIINANGGVTFSNMNDVNARKRCDKIRNAIETAKRDRDGVTLAYDPNRPCFKENNHV